MAGLVTNVKEEKLVLPARSLDCRIIEQLPLHGAVGSTSNEGALAVSRSVPKRLDGLASRASSISAFDRYRPHGHGPSSYRRGGHCCHQTQTAPWFSNSRLMPRSLYVERDHATIKVRLDGQRAQV
jgi:hypothetical protein